VWFDKAATRYPEALWGSFSPRVGDPRRWRLDVLGAPLDPANVVRAGGRHLHAVGRGAQHVDADGHTLVLETLDAALVAPGRPALLDLDDEPLPLDDGLHLCLANNVWGTNFPMWCDDDARFRVILRFTDPRWWAPPARTEVGDV
ncbi:MAG: hypothetical protein JJU45_03460, partial [Acidimicrobiia bacterium]|nr:hypothetical protein [Acidimicrobiia bacterium]